MNKEQKQDDLMKKVIELRSRLMILQSRKSFATALIKGKSKPLNISDEARDLMIKKEGEFLKTADEQIQTLKNEINNYEQEAKANANQ